MGTNKKKKKEKNIFVTLSFFEIFVTLSSNVKGYI